MCGFCNVWVCVCVGVLVICVLVFIVLCIFCTELFVLFPLCIFILVCFVCRRRWEDNIKMNPQEVGGGRGDWMVLTQNRDRWRALVGTARNFRVP